MRVISRYLLPVLAAVIMTGCSLRTQAPAPVDKAGGKQPEHQQQTQNPEQKPPVQTVPTVPTVPTQPGPITHDSHPGSDGSAGHSGTKTPAPAAKVRHYDWGGAMSPMVSQMMASAGVSGGSVLLVDSVNNRTNGSLRTSDATNALVSAIGHNGKFSLVSASHLATAKQQLGLSPNDSLGSRSKAMGIARKVGAQYMLYTNATGNVNAPQLSMQLITVQSGEIVWSGKGAVQQIQ